MRQFAEEAAGGMVAGIGCIASLPDIQVIQASVFSNQKEVILFGFFSKKTPVPEPVAQPTPQYAPGSEIRYSPTLVEELKSDHKDLIKLYTQIKADFDRGDYKAVPFRLDEFRVKLQGHLLTENVRFYVYIDRVHGQDEMNSELIRGFRHEMDGIGRAALAFLKKYETIGLDKDLVSAFTADFAHIGNVLTKRIKQEETVLYPLYMPVF
ncbi:MAG: hemerythrin domain-containing protein [Sideroxyarcus sp.]|nr:hemerythrin domain-containing protein [Sideroxyarcus sp.]